MSETKAGSKLADRKRAFQWKAVRRNFSGHFSRGAALVDGPHRGPVIYSNKMRNPGEG
jgi:hypothetical protein